MIREPVVPNYINGDFSTAENFDLTEFVRDMSGRFSEEGRSEGYMKISEHLAGFEDKTEVAKCLMICIKIFTKPPEYFFTGRTKNTFKDDGQGMLREKYKKYIPFLSQEEQKRASESKEESRGQSMGQRYRDNQSKLGIFRGYNRSMCKRIALLAFQYMRAAEGSGFEMTVGRVVKNWLMKHQGKRPCELVDDFQTLKLAGYSEEAAAIINKDFLDFKIDEPFHGLAMSFVSK